MSCNEWYDKFYGVELPTTNPDGEMVLAFCENHWNILGKEFNTADKPSSPAEALEFLSDYEGDTDYGFAAAIAKVIGTPGIYVVEDSNNVQYCGIYAMTRFPWDEVPEHWAALTEKDVEGKVAPVVAELYGTCPPIQEHTLWFFG